MSDSKKLKIFHVITRLNVGGAALYNMLLANELAKLGDETWLIYGTVEKSEGNMLDYWDGPPFQFRSHEISELSREIRPVRDAVAFWKLLRLFWRERPDIVHTHTSKAGLLGRLAALLTGVPVKLHSFHGTVFQGYFGGFMNWFIDRCEHFLGRHTECIFADTAAVRAQALTHGAASEDRIHVLPLGLELDGYSDISSFRGVLRSHLKIANDVPLVGIVARLVPIKGVEHFLRAAATVVKDLPQARFVIVGDGELRSELEEMAEKLGIGGNVSFLGFWKELREIYSDIDVLTLSSLSEGCPVAILEGMAAGVPVVASAVGGVVDVIRDGENGMLFASGDAATMADRILKLLQNQSLAARLSESAKKDAFEKYTIRQSALMSRRWYGMLMSSKRTRGRRLVEPVEGRDIGLGPAEFQQ